MSFSIAPMTISFTKEQSVKLARLILDTLKAQELLAASREVVP